MTAFPIEERAAIRRAFTRGLRGVLLLAVVAGTLLGLHRFFADKFHDRTGKAEWIWQQHRFASREPVAFFAGRDIDLGPAPSWVRIKVAADPEYTLVFNGREIAGGAADRVHLDEYDVTALARPGRNRILASIRSPEGVGGFLLSVDIEPERQNAFVTDGSWKIYRRWDDRLIARDLPGAEPPMLIGRPPIGKWNYPAARSGQPYGEARFLGYPTSAGPLQSSLPETRTIRGIAVTSRRTASAVLFDFGREVEGRGRIEMRASRPEVVRLRYVSSLDEVHTSSVRNLVVAAGESAVVDPQRHRFRYMLVFAPGAKASVVSETPM
jgi:hypothetical protein